MQIEWTELALEDYSNCITYLEENFSDKKVNEFIKEVNFHINLISKNPYTFPLSEYKNIRYLVIIKPITLFYFIKENTSIQIIRIWNNRKNKSRKIISL